MDFDPVLLARLQFAFTVTVKLPLPPAEVKAALLDEIV